MERANGGRVKILYVAKTFRPEQGFAMARLGSELARELTTLGHQVFAVSLDQTSAEETCPTKHGVASHRFPSAYPFFAYNEDLEDVLSNVPLSRRLIDLVEKEGPFDLVHAFGRNEGLAASLLRRVRGIPFVISLPGRREAHADGDDRRAKWIEEMSTWLGSRADRVLSTSFSGKDVDILRPAVRVEDFSAKVDMEDFRALFASPESRLILHAGHLIPDHGIERLIESLELLPSEVGRVRLVMVGDGPGRPLLESLVDRKGLKERIHFTGPLHTIVLGALYRAADVFVDPDPEGPGIAALEASCLGTSIVGIGKASAATAGFHHYAANEAKPLADAIARALPKLRSHQPQVSSRLTWRETAAELLAVYHATLATGVPS